MTYTDFLSEYWPSYLNGTLVTAQQTIFAGILAVFMATLAGLMKLSRHATVRAVAGLYIEFFRGTSLLVQLFWIFFVLPLFGITLEKYTAGIIAVGLNIGAYGAELVRGGIQSVPRGQFEATVALNMSPYKRMRRIILPQALLNMLPAWGNLLIELLKGTALVSLISVTDLMFEAKQINSSVFLSAQAFGTAMVIYYLLARVVITPSVRALERSLAHKQGRI
jgi:polar amino acid transport system permease protein